MNSSSWQKSSKKAPIVAAVPIGEGYRKNMSIVRPRINTEPQSTSQPARCTTIPKGYWLLGLASFCVVGFLPLLLIILHGVNVPFQDEYALATLTKAIRTGHASFETFWTPHNEHRIFFPKIAFTVLIPAIGWNPVAIMVVSWGVIMGAALFLFNRFSNIYVSSKPRLWLATVVTSFLIFFSPVQKENWLWAFQLSFFFVQIGVLLSVFWLSFAKINEVKRLSISIGWAVFASFSSAQGLMVWPALILTSLLAGNTKKRTLIACGVLCGATVFTYIVYFLNYKAPSVGHMHLDEMLRKPQLSFRYLVELLGTPLAFWIPESLRPMWAFSIGCLLLGLFMLFCYLAFRGGQLQTAAPWIGLGCFVLAFCLQTTYGRAGFGIDSAALVSRYTSHELLFTICVLVLGYVTFPFRKQSAHPVELAALTGLFCGVGICIFLGYLDGFHRAAREEKPKLFAKELLPFLTYFDPTTDGLVTGPFFPLCPAPNFRIFDIGLKPYEELGFVRTVKNAKFINLSTGLTGEYFVSDNRDLSKGNVALSGRIQSASGVEANLVFLKEEGKDKFIGATKLHSDKNAGREGVYSWHLLVAAQLLGNGERRLEMWVYDDASNDFLKVNH